MTRDPPLCALTRIFEGTDDAGTTDHTLNEPSTFPDTCIALLALFIINHRFLGRVVAENLQQNKNEFRHDPTATTMLVPVDHMSRRSAVILS